MQFTHFLELIIVFLYPELYSFSHTVLAVSLILILHNILFDCNSTVFSLLLLLLFLEHNIYFSMVKKLQDSLIPCSTNVEAIVKHSILNLKNQTDCQSSYAQSLLYSTKAETEPKTTTISIFLLNYYFFFKKPIHGPLPLLLLTICLLQSHCDNIFFLSNLSQFLSRLISHVTPLQDFY